jgi:membrane protein YqaA with SNARE-associated domain
MLLGALFVIALLVFSIFAADYVAQNDFAKTIIDKLGYIGIIIIGYIGGLNLAIPVPGPTLTPIFLAAGFSFAGIIVALSFGSLLADSTAYILGHLGRAYAKHRGSKMYERIQRLTLEKRRVIPLLVFAYASLVPLPNEIVVIPLALLGHKFRTIIVPLTLGTIVNVIILSLSVIGISNAFR